MTSIEEGAFANCKQLMCITAPKGSCAEQYAAKAGIPFEILELKEQRT
ncbi:MAG: hypothetical protein IJH70_14160 [Oscillospiraceae bacterium]|nr:hypothetical protein [Oscillospiraceae bacterium]